MSTSIEHWTPDTSSTRRTLPKISTCYMTVLDYLPSKYCAFPQVTFCGTLNLFSRPVLSCPTQEIITIFNSETQGLPLYSPNLRQSQSVNLSIDL